MNKEIQYSYFLIIYIKHVNTRLARVFYDDLGSVLDEHIQKINNFLGEDIFIYTQEKGLISQGDHIKKTGTLGELFQNKYFKIERDIEEKIIYDFSSLLLEDFSGEDCVIPESLEEIIPQSSFLYNMIHFIYYAFSYKDHAVSIEYITKIIENFPKISSFLLLRVRMSFRFLYQNISVENFNILVKTQKGIDLIQDNPVFHRCIEDISLSHRLCPQNPITSLFEGQIYLHFLDGKGVDILKQEFLYKRYAQHINQWLLVYNIRKNNITEAKKILTLPLKNDTYSQVIQGAVKIYISKLENDIEIFLQILSKYKSKIIYENHIYDCDSMTYIEGVFDVPQEGGVILIPFREDVSFEELSNVFKTEGKEKILKYIYGFFIDEFYKYGTIKERKGLVIYI